MSHSPSQVRVANLTLRYPGATTDALSGINLTIDPGSITVFAGPSGSGKTTLLKIIGGLLRPTTGELFVDGSSLTKSLKERKVGWVPQQYALFEHMTVAGNVEFGLKAQKVEKAERTRRVQEVLELAHISNFADRSVGELSGGQRQRVALARALAPNPKVLLLDEPLAALDPQLRVALRAELTSLIRDAGVTTILVTHDQEEALAMADKIVLLKDGQLVQADTPDVVWNAPVNAWVAHFIGRAHALQLSEVRDGVASAQCGLQFPSRGEGHLGIVRSADIEALTDPHGAEATVLSSEFAGTVFRLETQIGDEMIPAHCHTHAMPGDQVWLRPTGKRIPVVTS